jgi:dipeptidyl aminopeptidase/acylaminoacyl peptidase
MDMYRKIILTFFLLLPISCLHAESLPLEYFNQMPMLEDPVISPNGEHLAGIYNSNEKTQVVVMPFGSQDLKALVTLGGEEYRINSIYWANNKRLLINVSQPYEYKGLRLRTTHLFSADLEGKNVFEMRRSINARVSTKTTELDFYFNSPRLLNILPNDADHILVTTRDSRDGNYASVFKVNINDGGFKKHIANTNRINNWITDKNGEILLAIGGSDRPRDDTKYVYLRENQDADWKLIKKYTPFESETFDPIMYEKETNSILLLSDHELNKTALWRFDIKKNQFTDLVAKAPGEFDISNVIFKPSHTEMNVIGYTYVDDFVRRVYWDSEQKNIGNQLAKLLSKSGLQSNIYDYSLNKNRYIISAISDSSPVKYYLFDKNKKSLSLWFSQFPYLEGKALANVTPFTFNARDGMEIYGYITLPNGVEKPPVILFPHGGPYARDYQYFDPYVQMMANEGYAVLQVNFRGSTGYGNKYMTSGYHQWGRAMQTDLLDAYEWLLATELVHKDKACIAGASYGGYAALVAGYQTPELFDCIVSIAGVSDLGDQMTMWRRLGSFDYIDNAVNGDDTDIKAVSPYYHTEKFKKPVLLIHGKKDTRVSYRQSSAMYDQLKSAGKDVMYKEFDYGTHYLDDATNRANAMKLMKDFFEEHLK